MFKKIFLYFTRRSEAPQEFYGPDSPQCLYFVFITPTLIIFLYHMHKNIIREHGVIFL
jgi:hypothetical protein